MCIMCHDGRVLITCSCLVKTLTASQLRNTQAVRDCSGGHVSSEDPGASQVGTCTEVDKPGSGGTRWWQVSEWTADEYLASVYMCCASGYPTVYSILSQVVHVGTWVEGARLRIDGLGQLGSRVGWEKSQEGQRSRVKVQSQASQQLGRVQREIN